MAVIETRHRWRLRLGLAVALIVLVGTAQPARAGDSSNSAGANPAATPSASNPAGTSSAISAATAPAPAAPQTVNSQLQTLRTQQQTELNQLRDTLRTQAQQPGANSDQLKQTYNQEVKDLQQKFLAQDTRTADIQKTVADSNGAIKNTGSNPKDVRADVDLAASNQQAADDLAAKWQARGDVVEPLPDGMGYVNKSTDTTLWNPCDSAACQQAKMKYYDAFGTPGGRAATGNTTEAGDPYGFGLDNEKKFNHSVEGDNVDLKTAAKSVDKAAQAAGTADPEDPFWNQAKTLREYGDPVQAGIADPADPPDVQAQKVKDWLAEARTKMDTAVRTLQTEGRTLDSQRQQAADELRQSSNPEDQALADQLEQNRVKIDQANAEANKANLESRNGNGHGGDEGTSGESAAGASASEVGGEAAKGALAAAAADFMACAAQMGIDNYEHTEIGAKSVNECLARLYSYEGLKGISTGAILGAIAAFSPAGAAIVAIYGGVQGAKQIASAGSELAGAAGAINNMQNAEANQQQVSQANCDDTESFQGRQNAVQARIQAFEAECATFGQQCDAALSANNAPTDQLQPLRSQVASDKAELNRQMIQFGYSYSACQGQLGTDDLVLAWTGRITVAGAVLDRNPNCGSNAPAGQGQNVQALMASAQDPNADPNAQPSPPASSVAQNQPAATDTAAAQQAQASDQPAQQDDGANAMIDIGAALTGMAAGMEMQQGVDPAPTYYPEAGSYNPAPGPRYRSARPCR